MHWGALVLDAAELNETRGTVFVFGGHANVLVCGCYRN